MCWFGLYVVGRGWCLFLFLFFCFDLIFRFFFWFKLFFVVFFLVKFFLFFSNLIIKFLYFFFIIFLKNVCNFVLGLVRWIELMYLICVKCVIGCLILFELGVKGGSRLWRRCFWCEKGMFSNDFERFSIGLLLLSSWV